MTTETDFCRTKINSDEKVDTSVDNSVTKHIRFQDQMYDSNTYGLNVKETPKETGYIPSTESLDKPRKAQGVKIKPATYDGSSSWLDYKAHFEVCAKLNEWSYHEKSKYLAVSLRGQAQGVFGSLERTNDYTQLVRALQERFSPPNQTDLYRIRERRQRASEILAALGQDIRRLANMAYPTAPADVRETLAKEQFIDALVSSDMRLRIKQARLSDLNDAVRHAVELDAFNSAERKQIENQGYMRNISNQPTPHGQKYDTKYSNNSAFEKLQKTVDALSRDFNEWKESNRRVPYQNKQPVQESNRTKRACYKCGSEDHLANKCPQNIKSRTVMPSKFKSNVNKRAIGPKALT